MSSVKNLIGLGLPGALAEQLGYIEYAGTPSGNVTPKFVGQRLFDTSNSNFYISTGTANTNWKSETS